MKTYLTDKVHISTLTSALGLVAAFIGFLASMIITVEKSILAENPDYVPSCSLNQVISCSPVMSSPQATFFGDIPNPLLGISGFSIVAFLFFISFFVKLPRFVWVINSIGTVLALVFCFWLATQALYVINAICVYCFIVWMMTSVLAWLSLKPLLEDTKLHDFQFWIKLGMIITLSVFLIMIFFAFQEYWMSLL